MLSVAEKIKIVSLTVFRVLGEIACAIEKKGKTPGRKVIGRVAKIVKSCLNLFQFSRGKQDDCIDSGVASSRIRLPVNLRNGLVRRQRMVQSWHCSRHSRDRRNSNILAECSK